jgi:serine acetyltransferase
MKFSEAPVLVQMQLINFYGYRIELGYLHDLMPAVEERYLESYNHVRPLLSMTYDKLDPSSDSRYAMFLWFLSNEMFFQFDDPESANFVQALNKALHGCHIPFDALMPNIFYLPHTQGIVIARKVMLKNYLCLYQGTTIGRVGDKYPTFEGPLIMYPYSSVTGSSYIGKEVILNAGYITSNEHKIAVMPRSDLFDFHFIGWKYE